MFLTKGGTSGSQRKVSFSGLPCVATYRMSESVKPEQDLIVSSSTEPSTLVESAKEHHRESVKNGPSSPIPPYLNL